MQEKLKNLRKTLFTDYADISLLTLAFLIPIKLSLLYIAIIPLTLIWLTDLKSINQLFLNKNLKVIYSPLLSFFIIAFICSLWGINPLNSLTEILEAVFFTLAIPVFFELIKNSNKLIGIFALLSGQCLASCHTLFEEGSHLTIPKLFIGKLTESGQLSLVLILSIATVIYLRANKSYSKQTIIAVVSFTILALITFITKNYVFKTILYAIYLCLVVYFIYIFFKNHKNQKFYINSLKLVCFVVIPLLTIALLLNLKRGPWAGVAIGSTLLLSLSKPRYVLAPVLMCFIILISFKPISDRVAQSSEHFYIAGGRSTIWKIGTELSGRYPLGIGYGNSEFVRKFDKKIPPELRHFHSNFINILVETGWITFGIFIWWLIVIFKFAFQTIRSNKNFLEIGIACAILSWQIAGLGEYNFGDSEILFIVYFLLGVLANRDLA